MFYYDKLIIIVNDEVTQSMLVDIMKSAHKSTIKLMLWHAIWWYVLFRVPKCNDKNMKS